MFFYLILNKTISNKQFELLPGRSTTLQLLRALDDCTAELDKGNEVEVIHADFRKAHRRSLLSTIARCEIKSKLWTG